MRTLKSRLVRGDLGNERTDAVDLLQAAPSVRGVVVKLVLEVFWRLVPDVLAGETAAGRGGGEGTRGGDSGRGRGRGARAQRAREERHGGWWWGGWLWSRQDVVLR